MRGPLESPDLRPPIEPAEPTGPSPVRIFWTGGWDSSYRVLELAISLCQIVQPYYFHDATRSAAPRELHAIESILRDLSARAPEARARIRPLQLIPMVWHLVLDDAFSRSITAIRAHTDLGVQYAYIARECARLNLAEVEMCIHVGDHATDGPPGKFARLFRDRLECVTTRHGLALHRLIPPSAPAGHDAISHLFSPFLFPLHNITKLQTRDRARTLGFESLLHHTWFCHHPRSGRPCGVCNPCRYAIADGFGWRIGLLGHGRRLYRTLRLSLIPPADESRA